MQCPSCKLINPPTAKRCDCGYDFETGKVERPYLQQPLPPELRQGAVVLAIVNIVGGLAALVSGDALRIILALVWSAMVWWVYRKLVQGQDWARRAFALLTFPFGLFLVLSPEVKLYCRQQQRT